MCVDTDVCFTKHLSGVCHVHGQHHLLWWSNLCDSSVLFGNGDVHRDPDVRLDSDLRRQQHLSGVRHVHRIDDLSQCANMCGSNDLFGDKHLRGDDNL